MVCMHSGYLIEDEMGAYYEEQEYYMPFVTEIIEKGMFAEYDYYCKLGIERAKEKGIQDEDSQREYSIGMAQGALTSLVKVIRNMLNSGLSPDAISEKLGEEMGLVCAVKESYLVPGKTPVKCSLFFTEENGQTVVKDVATGITAQADTATEATNKVVELLEEYYKDIPSSQKKDCVGEVSVRIFML